MFAFAFALLPTAVVAIGLSLSTNEAFAAAAATVGSRSIFLNGVDISSAKSQDLKHVDIHISESGDLFIIAPHYQVNEEDTYVPLSKYVQGLNQPAHKAPQAIEAGRTRELPSDVPGGGQLLPKAGEVPLPVAASPGLQAKAGSTPAPPPATPPVAGNKGMSRDDDGPKALATPVGSSMDQAVPLDPAVPPAAAVNVDPGAAAKDDSVAPR